MNLLTLFNGKKTHLTAGIAAVLLFGSWQHWWTIPEEIYGLLMAAALVFLRAGVQKSGPAHTQTPDRATRDLYPLLLIPILILGLGASGCATQNVPGRILATSAQTVDAAMQGWWTHELLNHPPQDQVDQVRRAYADYQLAMDVATDAYVAYNGSTDTFAWSQASRALQASQQSLLDLVNQFTAAP